jgi:hypothetical protein
MWLGHWKVVCTCMIIFIIPDYWGTKYIGIMIRYPVIFIFLIALMAIPFVLTSTLSSIPGLVGLLLRLD